MSRTDLSAVTIKSPEPSTMPAPPDYGVILKGLYHDVMQGGAARSAKAPALCLCAGPILRAGRCVTCAGLVLP